jgi:hypothetical protein
MITVFIIAIGEQNYKRPALAILRDYFSQFSFIKLYVLENDGDLNIKKAHPSWLKLISHQYTRDDNLTLCWDLDLLPLSKNSPFDFSLLSEDRLSMCYDTSVTLGFPKFNSNFYFNGGLISIPFSQRCFVESVYNNHAPGLYPSYEQYYLNDAIAMNGQIVNRLPLEYNTLYHDGELFRRTSFAHYTWQCNDSSDRDKLIQKHYENYFSHNSFN